MTQGCSNNSNCTGMPWIDSEGKYVKSCMYCNLQRDTDEAKLAAYAAMAPATVERYGGQFLARGYPVALRESGQKERTVVGIWESIDVALQWYESPEYKECLEVLGDGAVRDIKFLDHI